MKKTALLFAAVFMMIFTVATAPAIRSHAKSINRKVPDGKYYTVKESTKVKLNGNRVTIKGYLDGYGSQKEYGKIRKTVSLARGVKFSRGMEVNEDITNKRITRTEFSKRLKKGKFDCINFKFKNGKVTAMKLVSE